MAFAPDSHDDGKYRTSIAAPAASAAPAPPSSPPPASSSLPDTLPPSSPLTACFSPDTTPHMLTFPAHTTSTGAHGSPAMSLVPMEGGYMMSSALPIRSDWRAVVPSCSVHGCANTSLDSFGAAAPASLPQAFSPFVFGATSVQGFAIARDAPYSALPSLPVAPLLMAKHVFLCSYVNTLLPALRRIHSQSCSISRDEKQFAVKLAADMSLALSVGRNMAWSQALLEEVASCSSGGMPLLCFPKASPCRRPARREVRNSGLHTSCFSTRKKMERGRSTGYAGGGACSKSRACCSSTKPGHNVDLSSYPSSALVPGTGLLGCSRALSSENSSRRHRLFLKPRKPEWQRGLLSYRKVLRSSRCQKSSLNKNVSASSHEEHIRTSSHAISKEHIESLGGLVPGGRNMDVPLLLQEAADYILSLQMQVEALESLSQLVSSTS